jgi:hypothetical protein
MILKTIFIVATMHVLVPSELTKKQQENIEFIQSISRMIGSDPYEMLAFSYVFGNLGDNNTGALYMVDCNTSPPPPPMQLFNNSCQGLQRDRVSNFLFFSYSLATIKRRCEIQDTRTCMEHVLGKEESNHLYKIRQDFERLSFLKSRRLFNFSDTIQSIRLNHIH